MAKSKNPEKIARRIANRNKYNNINTLFEALVQGNRLALSKAITIIESQKTEDHNKAIELIELCLKHQNQSKNKKI
jgi:LAO/AO transport system kinase